MTREITLGLLRHVLTAAGGSLLTKGLVDAATLDAGIGAVITLLGIIWSVADKKRAR